MVAFHCDLLNGGQRNLFVVSVMYVVQKHAVLFSLSLTAPIHYNRIEKTK